jgi:hypothetical protein
MCYTLHNMLLAHDHLDSRWHYENAWAFREDEDEDDLREATDRIHARTGHASQVNTENPEDCSGTRGFRGGEAEVKESFSDLHQRSVNHFWMNKNKIKWKF